MRSNEALTSAERQRRSVMEFDALVQLERVGQAVGGHVPALGEVADDLAVLAAVVLHEVGEHRADGMQQRERLRGMAVVVGRLGGDGEIQHAAALGRLRRCGRQRRRCEKKREAWLSSQVSLQPPCACPLVVDCFHAGRQGRAANVECGPARACGQLNRARRVPAEAQSSRKTFRTRRIEPAAAVGEGATSQRAGRSAAPGAHDFLAARAARPACSGRSPCGRCGRCRTRGSRGRGRCGRNCRCARSGNRGRDRCQRPAAPKARLGQRHRQQASQSAQR